MIIRGSENIYPKEIETALYGHDGVLEAAVAGRPDRVLGEVVIAYVALRPGADVTVDELDALRRPRSHAVRGRGGARRRPSLA